MLQNAYFLSKIGFVKADNEPAKNLQKNCKPWQNLPFLLKGGNVDIPPPDFSPGVPRGVPRRRGRRRRGGGGARGGGAGPA